jgi:hypothetical protein
MSVSAGDERLATPMNRSVSEDTMSAAVRGAFGGYRLRQGIGGFRPRVPADRDAILATLSGHQAAAFRALPAYDQAHLCRTFSALREAGIADPDLLAAGLLHDLGKGGVPGVAGKVRLTDRVLRVVLRRCAPRLLARAARLPAPRWRVGLALAVHHPRLGAGWAAELGCSPRTCWLIAHHEDEPAPDDPDLRRLDAADRAAG